MNITRRRLRLPCDLFSFNGPSDKRTSQTPQLWLSNDYSIELAFFYGAPAEAALVTDLSTLATLTLEIKALGAGGAAPSPSAAPLASKTIADFTATTWAAWSADTGWQAQVLLTAEEMQLAAGDAWLVVSAITHGGQMVTLLAGKIALKEDGYNSAGSAPVLDGTAFTKAEALALFARDRNDITARTGGGAGKLDGIATAAGAWVTGQSIRTRSGAGGGREEWVLEAGNNAENAGAGIVRPDDYAAGTNERVWKQIL